MSTGEGSSKNGEEAGMPAGDVTFLIECLKHTTGGAISVDMSAVAEALNYKNPRSVGNRLAALKKKYDLPITTTGKGKAGEGSSASPAISKTEPSKNRVTKTRAPAKKAVEKKAKQVVKAENGNASEAAPSVRTPEYLDADEELLALAGPSSEDESGAEI